MDNGSHTRERLRKQGLLPTLTPCQRDNAGGAKPGPTRPSLQSTLGYLPTVTTTGNCNRIGASETSGNGLGTVLRHLPTLGSASAGATSRGGDRKSELLIGGLIRQSARQYLPTATATATAAKGSSDAALTRKDGKSRVMDRIDHCLHAAQGGAINPEWAEFFMGFPLGWTALAPLPRENLDHWLRTEPREWFAHEPGDVPRTVAPNTARHRAARVSALGDAWVPACAVEAWRMMTEE